MSVLSVQRILVVVLVSFLLATPSAAQTGHVLNGIGAVNQSMAGAGTGHPLDASGALQWNPAGITALGSSQIQFSMELLKPTSEVTSSVSFPGKMSGSTESDAGISPIPSFGLVHQIEDSNWSWGIGAFGISGFGVDYREDASNPILMAPPNGFGAVYSQFQMLQLAPTAAYQMDENWSFGIAPTINWAQLAVDPMCGSPPDDANGDTVATYPSAAQADSSWGYGAQIGVFYSDAQSGWNFGASYKTKQDFQDFNWNSTDEIGNFRRLTLDLDFPAIASIGVGYSGFKDLELIADVRYIDYKNTDGFGEAKFNRDFSVNGFGWDSIFVLALGLQYQLSESFWVRAGYAYNENPIPDANSTFNLPAPAVIQHHASFGLSWALSNSSFLDLGYRHGFENSVEGQMGHPTMGKVPGSSVKNSLSTDSLLLGIRVNF
ncbi:MAG: hypothetical protein DWQ01_16505 [Planctomycetota bacterium]|nr:MAG: hypothetical protein DWQ01_16505 [Planctomycetota bacterium]